MSTVVNNFVIWYQQLPLTEQQELYTFLVEQITAAQSPGQPPSIHFGGQRVHQAPRAQHGPVASGAVCPTCNRRVP